MTMMTPERAAGLAAQKNTSPTQYGRIASQGGQPTRVKPLMRKYEVAHLTPHSHDIEDFTRIAPSMPQFEDAFAAIGRGAILQTDKGRVAVEDLLPGDRVMTASSGLQTLLWKGAMSIVPGARNARPEMGTMTRITSDAFGFGRPGPDLVLGPSARIFHRAPGMRTLTGSEAAFVPARDFIDGSQVIELRPIAPVHVYQLGFEYHERINVNGIEIESLHPGAAHMIGLRGDMLALFMSLFPHRRDIFGFGSPSHPRIRLRDLDLFNAA